VTEAVEFPKTLMEAITYFADPDRALRFFVEMRWPDGITCPRCGHCEVSFISTRRIWKCKGCRKQFSAKVGTIMEDSPLGLDKWMACIWIDVNAKNAVKKDNPFEAKCRKIMDAALKEKTEPGVPAGDVTDANGQTLTEDLAPNECTMADLFVQALKKAGKNPTTDKLYDAFLTLKSNPAAYMSNGQGGFSPSKTYFVNQVHLEILNQASTQTAKDANGLYNGCPAPVNCWVPQLIGGSEWFAVQPAT